MDSLNLHKLPLISCLAMGQEVKGNLCNGTEMVKNLKPHSCRMPTTHILEAVRPIYGGAKLICLTVYRKPAGTLSMLPPYKVLPWALLA